jgi:capsid protein
MWSLNCQTRCLRIVDTFRDVAVLSGALDIPGYERHRATFIACSWLPPKWDWVDPLKDAKAEIEQIGAGLKSRTQALAERGLDAEQVDAEIAADREREQRLGLSFGNPQPMPAGQAGDQAGIRDSIMSRTSSLVSDRRNHGNRRHCASPEQGR